MNLERMTASIAHNPRQLPWGVRGSIDVPYHTRADGKPGCRWCHGPLTGRRTSWCGPDCVDAYSMRSRWGMMRVYVLRRDQHRCRLCAEHGHELAVVDGGTDDPANLRLLCVPCHKAATAALANRRASERRSIGLPLEAR